MGSFPEDIIEPTNYACFYGQGTPFPLMEKPAEALPLEIGHWGGVEIRNHWRKDACLLEDKTRSRNPMLVGAFAMLRNILLFMHKEQDNHSTLPGFPLMEARHFQC